MFFAVETVVVIAGLALMVPLLLVAALVLFMARRSAAPEGNVEAISAAALRLINQDKVDDALRVLTRGLRKFPNDSVLLCNRAMVHQLQEHLQEALRDIDAALANPNGIALHGVHHMRGRVLLEMGRFQEAEGELDTALRLLPQGASPMLAAQFHADRAAARLGAGKAEVAAQDASRALEMNPNHDVAQELLEAAGAAKRQTGPAPGQIDALGSLAAMLMQQGEHRKARDVLTRIIELDPTISQAWYMRAECKKHIGGPQDELPDLTRSIELDGNEVALFNRALCYIRLNRPEDARADLEAFLRVGIEPEARTRAESILRKL